MIRDSVLTWGAVLLVVVLAFVLIPTFERFKDAQGREVDVDPNAPPMPEWLKPINERTGTKEGYENPVTMSTQGKGQLPPAEMTVSSTTPSGSATMPSLSMPNNPMMGTVGSNLGMDSKVLSKTIPGPKFESGPEGIQGEDKYVLKSSLQPCACGTGSANVPGGNDNGAPQSSLYAPDGVRKPFSAAFGDKTDPEGYLNSFSAFMK